MAARHVNAMCDTPVLLRSDKQRLRRRRFPDPSQMRNVLIPSKFATNFSNCAGVHRVRSKVRGEEDLGCFMFFIFGFVMCSLRRTPRPPAELCPPGLINSIPAFSSAETNFIRESTFPRITPSLASMR